METAIGPSLFLFISIFISLHLGVGGPEVTTTKVSAVTLVSLKPLVARHPGSLDRFNKKAVSTPVPIFR